MHAGLNPLGNTRKLSVPVSRARSVQHYQPKPLQSLTDTMLSAHLSRTFATKSSVVRAKGQRQPISAKSHPSASVGRGEARQTVPAISAQQPFAFAAVAPSTVGLPRSSGKVAAAGARISDHVPWAQATPSTHQKQGPSSHRQGSQVTESETSSYDADQDRRQRSASNPASTSGLASSPRIKGHTNTGLTAQAPSNQKHRRPAGAPTSARAADGTGRDPHAINNPSVQSAVTSNGTKHNTAPQNGAVAAPTGFNQAEGHTSDMRTPRDTVPQTTNGSKSADTSAASNDARQSTDSVPSAEATPSEPSMYAQREVPFDVTASRRNGTAAIRDLLETQKITLQEYAPGQKPKVLCPRCHGGSQHEASLAVNISVDSQSAAWMCHRATCGWEGGIDQKTGTGNVFCLLSHHFGVGSLTIFLTGLPCCLCNCIGSAASC